MTRDKRKAQRRPLHHTACVVIAPDQMHGCFLSDVSDSGARIDVDDSAKLPDRFFLLLSMRGRARRLCSVVWRKPKQLGVKFERAIADTEKELAPPQPVVETVAEPAPECAEQG
jgi:hypothetical protein